MPPPTVPSVPPPTAAPNATPDAAPTVSARVAHPAGGTPRRSFKASTRLAAQADADLAAVFIHEGEQYFAVFISLAIVDQIDEGKRVIDRRPVYAPALRGFVL